MADYASAWQAAGQGPLLLDPGRAAHRKRMYETLAVWETDSTLAARVEHVPSTGVPRTNAVVPDVPIEA